MRGPVLLLASLCLSFLVPAGPSAGAAPAFAIGEGNVTRFAQAEWTTKKGPATTHWMLTAWDLRQVRSWTEASAESDMSVTLSRGVCWKKRDYCEIGGRDWPLDGSSFSFDPGMESVTVSLPGKVEITWTATGGPQPTTHRWAQPAIYGEPSDFVGAEPEVGAVAAIGRPAEVSGRIKGYRGRVSSTRAVIQTWTGVGAWAGVCVLDEGFPCL